MNIIRRIFDKLTNRFVVALLNKMDERDFHPQRLLLEKAQSQAANYAEKHMKAAVVLDSRDQIIEFSFDRATTTGAVLEFGVANGESLRLIAGLSRQIVHGFDSFDGLPEDWGGRHEGKGHYSTGGQLPTMPENVRLHKGLFDQTVPDFLNVNDQTVKLLHIDCDLYRSTKTALTLLAPKVVPGTIIIFDEYFNFTSWREHEYKAFQEFVEAFDVKYSYICWGFQQVVVRIDEIRSV